MKIKVEDLIRGAIIEYQDDRQFIDGKPNKEFGKWFMDIIWGYTTDNDQRDMVEVGKFGVRGYIDLSCIRGLDITEDMLLDYGFQMVTGLKNLVTYYRDDVGHFKLTTYGIEHIYMNGKVLRYWHDFQRVFYDYTGKQLHPKVSELPKKEIEFQSQYFPVKPKTDEDIVRAMERTDAILNPKNLNIDIEL